MKKILRNIIENYKIVLIMLLTGLFLGWLLFHSSGRRAYSGDNRESAAGHVHSDEKATIWTCSMHPQVRSDKPGKCPICGMDLVPLSSLTTSEEQLVPNALVMTEDARKLADIQTIIVKRGSPEKSLYLQGKVQADERNINELTARFGGRIEKLFINFTGQHVRKGEKLATIYSPDLVTAQRELLEAVGYKESRPALYTAARGKLKLWDLSDKQISDIEKLGEPKLYFDINSPITGTVTMRHVALGDYIKEGNALFQVVDLTRVWALFDAYESDLPWIRKGDKAVFTIESLPGRTFYGKVAFIDPFINASTRVAKVRVELNNPELEIKPGMFINGTIQSKIAGRSHYLLIPKSSVLWTGKRSVVYVKVPDRENPTFLYRQITLGPETGNFYIVQDGLTEGEEIVTNGTFKIDAAAQLQGLPSMMNPEGGKTSTRENAPKTNVSADFKMQLNKVYDSYIILKNAFVSSNEKNVKEAVDMLQDALGNVEMNLLAGNTMTQWMNLSEELNNTIRQIKASDNLKDQRKSFSLFNDSFYRVIGTFGLMGKTVYYQFCPMMDDNKGAYWLSETGDIRNPYYGDEMLTCGETRDTLVYR